MAATENRAQFLRQSDFAVAAAYNVSTPVSVIFDEPDAASADIDGTNPTALGDSANFPNSCIGKTLYVGGVLYTIRGRCPVDDGAFVTLQLEWLSVPNIYSYTPAGGVTFSGAAAAQLVTTLYAVDDFERAGPGLGANWAQDSGSSWGAQTVEISGGKAVGHNAGQSAIAYWSAKQPAADQWAAATIDGVFPYPGVACRLTPGASTCYFLMCSDAGTIFLYRYDAGAQVGLATINPPGLSLAADDEVMLEVITLDANTVRLSVYKNGIYVGGYDDVSANRITVAGYVGLHVWGTSGVRAWRAGDVAANMQGYLVTGMQSFDATAASGTTAAFTVPPYTDAALVVWSDWAGGAGNVMQSLSIGGQSLLPALTEIPHNGGSPIVSNIGIGLKVAPTSGQKTLSWAWSINSVKNNGAITVLFLRGLKRADPYRNAVTAQTEGAADCQITVNSAAGDLALCVLHNLSGSAMSGVNFYAPGPFGGRNVRVSRQPGAATVTFTMDFENYPSMAAISLKPAA